MRNLKKILALVLALVMSLSLMATASATDFKDVSDISENYQTAVNVLSQLEVFKGYAEDGTFRPKGEITRAEVATIIYRIATGDAKDAQASIYTNMTTSFTDLDKAEWARGYVNYCHNAQIIKGESATKFNPNGKITGYATLAMILRAMGYGKNGEFEGTQWEYNTASTAKQIGLIDNVIEAQLGSNAPRELVAEILFRALLTEMVDYTVLNGYVKNGKTLGYEKFKLEDLQGVVVANEFANLYGTSVLADGKTNLEVAKDDIRSLDVATEITDIGMRQHVYITGSTVLDMDDTDLNKVTETGAEVDIDTPAKFRAAAEMNQVGTGDNATQFYINFGRTGNNTCDQRLEFSVTFQNETAMNSFDTYAGVDISAVAAGDNLDNTADNNWTVNTRTLGDIATNETTELPAGNLNVAASNYVFVPGDYPVTFKKVIRATNDISVDDLAVMFGIFGAADNNIRDSAATSSTWFKDWITGDVFVGTISSNTALREEEDLSNKISYNNFVETYINPETYDVNWNWSGNGSWVKFIDNDLDGDAEYAFRTDSWLDEAVGTFTVGDNTYVEYNRFNEQTGNVRYMDGETPAVGDVVVVALIDGQRLVEPAKDVTETVNVYNWKDDTITTTDGNTYGQSMIGNATGMQQLLDTMDERTEYIMYFDHFGYVRAYELPGGTQYALLTEIYATNNQTGNVLQNWPMTVELKAGEADPAEYNIAGGSNSAFVAMGAPWTEVYSRVGSSRYYNWLQPAIAHLGVTRLQNNVNPTWTRTLGPVRVTPSFTGPNTGYYTFWTDWQQAVRGGIVPGVTTGATAGIPANIVSEEFNYGTQNIGTNNAAQQNTVSFTNVAAVNITDNNAVLKGAAELRLDRNGNPTWWDTNGNDRWDADEQARYAVDYVQLTRADVVADQTMYPVDPAYGGWQNTFVNATHDTEYYIVHNGGVEYFKDYLNMPALTAGNNYIHAAYAVARDTSEDNSAQPYWVADVIVYEVRTWNDDSRTSVSLIYNDLSRTTGQVRLLETLNSAAEGSKVNLSPAPLAWNADAGSFDNFSGYWMYQVWNGSDVTDGQMTARRITRIPEAGRHYADYGVYAGVVDRVTLNSTNGGYITVDMYVRGGGTRSISLSVSDNVFNITTDRTSGSSNFHNAASNIRYNNLNSNQVQPGDLIIWQGGAPNTADWSTSTFIVDLGNPTPNTANFNMFANTAEFLVDKNRDAAGNVTGMVNPDPVAAGFGASNSGLFQDIRADQTRNNDAAASWKVTVKSVVPNGFATPDDKEYTVPLDGNLKIDFTKAPYLINGLAITDVTPKTTGSQLAGGTTVTTSTNAALELTGVAENVTVTVTYSVVSYTLKGGTYTYTAPTAGTPIVVTANSTTLSAGGAPDTLTGLSMGSNVRLVVTLDPKIDTTTQEVVLTFDRAVGPTGSASTTHTMTTADGTSFYYDFTMPNCAGSAGGATTNELKVDVTVQNKATDITVTENANITTDSTTITGNGVTVVTPGKTARTTWGGDVTIAPSVAAGYEVTGVTVSANGSPVAAGDANANWALTTGGNGTANIVIKAAGDCLNKAVVVTFTVEPIKSDLAFSFTGYTVTASVAGAGTITDAAGGGIVSGTTTISGVTIDSVITLTITGKAAPGQVDVRDTGGAVVVAGVQVTNETGTSTNTWTYTITGVGKAGTITIA